MAENRSEGDNPAPEEGQSRALSYDPGKMMVRRKAVTAPLKPLEDAVRNRSPMMLVFGAIIILGMIVLAVVLAAGGEPSDVSDIELSGVAASCMVVAPDDVNVRGGPGYEYERVWILPGGQERRALDGFQDTWLRLENGWVAVAEVTLQSSSACAQLPQVDAPTIFADDILVPAAIDALDWHDILNENFATSVNGWAESAGGAGVQIIDGELRLSGATPPVFPVNAASWGALTDAYITFRAEWSAVGDNSHQLALAFRVDGTTFYELTLTRGGDLSLWRVDGENRDLLAETGLADTSNELGLLFNEEEIRVFADDEVQLTFTGADPAEGTYHLRLMGRNAEVRITRFEVKVPAPQD